jgi:hypothetical protein
VAQSAGTRGWGGSVVQTRMPSGVKLIMEPDSDAILKFVGRKDITERLAAAGKYRSTDGERVEYLIFHDGRRFVSMPYSFAFTDAPELEPGFWYYIHHQGSIEMPGRNPLKDFAIIKLGVDGEEVQCPERVADERVLVLAPETVAPINYNRLNYPLRKS